MHEMLRSLRERVVVGIVGGSDLPKQKEQMGEGVINEVDYSFSENGLVAYKQGELIGKEVGEQRDVVTAIFYNIALKTLSKIYSTVYFKISGRRQN